MAMQWSVLQVKQWRDSQQLKLSRNNSSVQNNEAKVFKWHPPSEGRMKVNVDAHIVAGCSWFSCGLILRDHQGKFIRARTHRFVGIVPVVEAEAIGVLEATRWINSLGMHDVDIESDSLVTVQAINKAVENYLEVGVVFQKCREFLNDRRDISVSFVKKQANKVAHLIARVPCEVNCFIDLMTPPRSVLEPLESESLIMII